MNSPPEKRRGSYTAPQVIELLRAYGFEGIWQGWAWEALRMLDRYWARGDRKHLAAFVTHVAAMRVHAFTGECSRRIDRPQQMLMRLRSIAGGNVA